ncbi:MAG: 2OG-Fe(II) oxygenase [Isosphaeraceae bacterium]
MGMDLMEVSLETVGEVRILRGFLPPAECEAWIARSERLGFRHGPNPESPRGSPPSERTHRWLAFLIDGLVARSLFQRAGEHLPPHWPRGRTGQVLEGFHPRIRFYRDEPSDTIPIHQDDPSEALDGIASAFTMMIFLNECAGGSVRFHGQHDGSAVLAELRPEAGTAMVFPHETWHEPAPVLAGRRYILRADVLYRNG